MLTGVSLEGIDQRYSEILNLTSHANKLLAELDNAADARKEYESTGFVKVRDIVPPDALAGLATDLLPTLAAVSEKVEMLQEPGSQNTLSDGARFRRVDPYCIHNPDTRQKLVLLLERLGLVDFSSSLALKLTPLIEYICGRVSYKRTYFYIYGEEDYISVHNDHHVGSRVDVQFPIALGTVAGVRVLSGGSLRMQYDAVRSMNVLGPCVWHDVPPV